MTIEERYAELAERMREVERQLDILDQQLDPDRHVWHTHVEIRRTSVTQQALDDVLSILENK